MGKPTKKLGADFPAALVDAFVAWCDARQLKIGASAGVALQLLMRLPPSLEHLARAGDWDRLVALLEQADYALAREVIARHQRRTEPSPPARGPRP